MAEPHATHPAWGNESSLFGEFVGDPVLAPRGLLDREGHDDLLEFTPDAIPQVGFAAADFAQRFFAARRIQLLEAIEAVTAVAHYLARLRHIPELLRKLQDSDFRLDNLLLSRHALSMSDCQITS